MPAPSIEDIERNADAGDADAQYALAAVWSQRQQQERARHWLERAAAQGHADALFTLAGAILTASEGAADRRDEAVAGLMRARENGSIAALRVLAALTAAGLVGDGGWPQALSMMREACERGEAASLREIATLLLEISSNDPDGEGLLCEAAKRDKFAGALLERRRQRGDVTNSGTFSLVRAFDKIAKVSEAHLRGEDISARPAISLFRSAFGQDLCDHLMGAALPRLKREQVLGADGQRRTHPHRTSWGAILGFGFADLPAVLTGQRSARIAGLPYSHGEPISILRYRPGQEYRVHYDFLSVNDPDLSAHGQRRKTALIYLNDGYVGGQTHFLAPDIRIAGKSGDVLVFGNVDENGEPDFSSRHAGRPIEKGEKWLASMWFRDRPFSA